MMPAFILLSFSTYLIPSAIAIYRNVDTRVALAAVNLLTGWTVIGWFAVLLWAALGPTDKRFEVTERVR
jgi:hypothetical protein